MNTVTLWLLITVSGGSYNSGSAAVLERFPSLAKCEEVLRTFTARDYVTARCVPATVVRP